MTTILIAFAIGVTVGIVFGEWVLPRLVDFYVAHTGTPKPRGR